ncbi:hypothetical protein HY772_05085 [Candidatus Woesearchaeota archaeon]|nr:hypothetical protein [Candidatus Woesearchaeota archaeon]
MEKNLFSKTGLWNNMAERHPTTHHLFILIVLLRRIKGFIMEVSVSG